MLRLALINGCREKANRYAQAVARLRDVQFTAIVQPDPVKRRDAAHELGVSIAVASLKELLTSHSGEIDAVVIHGSVPKRADLACAAAKAGKHVFVSSPLAATVEEVDRIAAACRAAGVTLMVGSHIRSRPSIAAVKSALDSGKLGEPALLRVHCWEPKGTGEPSGWEAIQNKDFGEFRSRVIQQLDLALWMFSDAPTDIYAVGHDQLADNSAWPEYVQIHLGFPNGGATLISISRSLPAGDDYQTVSLIGSTGAAYADDHPQTHLLFRGDHPAAVKGNEMVPAIVAQLRDFQSAIAAKTDTARAAEAMKAALKLTDTAWTSLVEHRPICLGDASHG